MKQYNMLITLLALLMGVASLAPVMAQQSHSSQVIWAGCDGETAYTESGFWPKVSGGEEWNKGMPVLWISTNSGRIFGLVIRSQGEMAKTVSAGHFANCGADGSRALEVDVEKAEVFHVGQNAFWLLEVSYRGVEVNTSNVAALLGGAIRPAKVNFSYEVDQQSDLVVPVYDAGQPQTLLQAANCKPAIPAGSVECFVHRGFGERPAMWGYAFVDGVAVGYGFGNSYTTGVGSAVNLMPFSSVQGLTSALQAMSVSMEEETPVPAAFGLGSPHPNPTAGSATIDLSIDSPQHIRAEAYDLLGRLVLVLHDDFVSPGELQLRFDGAGLPSGTYLVRVSGEMVTKVTKLVLR